MKFYTHLTLLGREQIFAFKQQGKTHKEIAQLVGRHRTTISRELKRNNRPHEHMIGYIGVLAHQQAKQRKAQSGQRLRLKSAVIRAYVEEKIAYGRSPEIIASQAPKISKASSISSEAIYQYIEGIPFLARRHKQRYTTLGTKSYFCQPYHSWEKGGVENSNGILRRFFPKKTDVTQVTQAQRDVVADWMNNRPRKCLGFKTPNEVFIELMAALPC